MVLPWSEIKVDAHTYSAKELAEGMSFFNQFVADMKARNDPLYSEAARVQSQLTKNLTPEQAATLYQEMIRLQQASVKKKEAVAAPRTELETRPIYDYALRLKLREMGIDPDQASIVISDEEIEQERKQDRETRERTMEALRSLGARYAVVVNKEVFFSPEEPRPYGAGYKFRVLRGREFFRP